MKKISFKAYKKIMGVVCDCNGDIDELKWHKITINRSDLIIHINRYNEEVQKKKNWHLPLTIALTLAIAELTTSFVDVIEVPLTGYSISTPVGMQTILHLSLFLSIFWTVVALLRSVIAGNPLEELLFSINGSIINRPDRTAIFIVKKEDEDGMKLLVEYKRSWNCYFLPYVKQHSLIPYASDKKEGLVKAISDKLLVNSDNIKVELMQDFNFSSEKFDPPQKVVKEYYFEIFHLMMKESTYLDDNFEVGDRSYCWKTLNELEEHLETKQRNKDVLNHLRDNYNELIVKVNQYHA
ncbi:hypothetical protein [Cobetia sp. QF-1]|uniref:hypothetical protein n=1 Tax=Cobetia sp. QF-1 TaxID=1969833 RepID=UPI000B545E03|nr:hypothetical protein [Cobetia sp. QF-1]